MGLSYDEFPLEDYKLLIMGRAYALARKFPKLDTQNIVQDMVAHGHVAYCEALASYDTTKGASLSTWIYCCVNNRLKQMTEGIVKEIPTEDLTLNELRGCMADNYWMRDDFLKELSAPSQTIVIHILDEPDDIMVHDDKPKLMIGAVRRWCLSKGMSHGKVWKCIREIKTAVSTIREDRTGTSIK